MDVSATAPSPLHAQTPAQRTRGARASRPSLHVTVSAVEGGSTSRIALQVRRWRCGLRVLGSCLSCRSRGSVCLVLLLYLLLDAHRIGPRSRKAYLRQRRNSAGTVPSTVPAAPGGPLTFRRKSHESASRARTEVTPESQPPYPVLSFPPGKPTRAVAVGRHTRLCTIRPSVLSVIQSARLNAWPGKAAHRRPAPCWNSQTARRARNRGRSCASRYGRS